MNMSVSNYTIEKCKYSIPKLDKAVYLLDKTSIGNVDTESYYIDGGAQATLIHCNSVTLSETSSLDERYRFTHTLNFQVDGYSNVDSLNECYYVVVKDMDGVFYLVNPEFKMKITYTYTLDSNGEHTDYSLSTISNIPLMRVDNFAPWASSGGISGDTLYKWVNITPTLDRNSYICDFVEDDFVCKPYYQCGIDKIMINETAYSTYNAGMANYTNSGFKAIEFTKNSAVFTETFDGERITHQLKFTLPYNNSSWHNLLQDFNDNKYCTIITTKCGMSIACGFEHGLMPSYNLTGSNTENDKIEITLSDLHDSGMLIRRTSIIDASGQTATSWVWVEGEYECVDDDTAKHLLQEEYDLYGNKMDLYKCLSGYSSQYSYLGDKLIGEFEDSQSIYFDNPSGCYGTECSLRTTLTNMEFVDKSTKYFKVCCNQSDWSISASSNSIVVSPSSGDAGVEYTVSVTNLITPSSAFGQSQTITITFCDDSYSVDYDVVIKRFSAYDYFPQGGTYHVNTKSQTLDIPTSNCVSSLVCEDDFVKKIQIQNGHVYVQIDSNAECDERTATLTATFCDNFNILNIEIIQDGNDCITPALYGEYSDGSSYTIPCSKGKVLSSSLITEMGAPDASMMSSCTIGNCVEKINDYAFTYCPNLQTVTIGSGITTIAYQAFGSCTALTDVTIYATTPPNLSYGVFPSNVQHVYVPCEYLYSYKAAWGTWTTLVPKITAIPNSCPEYYRTTSGTPYCQGFDKYIDIYEQVSYDSGATWTTVSTATTLMERNSTDCGYVPPQPPDYTRQPFTLKAIETSTFEFITTRENNLTYLEYSLDSGSTWLPMTSSKTPIVQAGNKIQFRNYMLSNPNSGVGVFSSSGKYSVEGNIMSLLYAEGFEDKTLLSGSTNNFIWLFRNSTNLVSAENFVLPATTLANFCYFQMFQGCTSLTTAPSTLPATTLADYCYYGMFQGCTSLTTVPSNMLPATTLATWCYGNMFYGCTSLTTAPSLPATTLAYSCYYQMFQGCTNLNYIKCLATDISANSCTSYWVNGVAASGTFIKATSMTSWTTGANGIPSGWTITNA